MRTANRIRNDQAAGLRRTVNSRPVKVITVTSGKGGVGKTNISANLSIAMANAGKRVLLLDADLGLANIDVGTARAVRGDLMSSEVSKDWKAFLSMGRLA